MDNNWHRGIVVGVDGSAESMAAVDWAALAADRHGARLTALGAYVTPPGRLTTTLGLAIADARADARYAVERAAARLDGAHPGGRTVGQRVVLGAPAYMLAQRSRSCDLVVVGRRGPGAWDRAVLGSVSGALAAMAPGPVAVVPAGTGTGDPGVVVASVSGDDAGPQLDLAFAQAQQRSRPLEVVHTLDPDSTSELSGPSAVLGDELRHDVADQVSRWSEKYPTVPHTLAFRTGDPVEALLRELGPDDLVVVGGRQHSPVDGHVRYSVADAVLHRSPCPVIVVHEQKG